MANRKRPIEVKFRCTKEERDEISRRMALLGTTNMAAYIRKMCLNGYIVNLDLPELRDMVSLLRHINANFNQIAKRVNTTGRLYDVDLQEMRSGLDTIWNGMNRILTKLACIK